MKIKDKENCRWAKKRLYTLEAYKGAKYKLTKIIVGRYLIHINERFVLAAAL